MAQIAVQVLPGGAINQDMSTKVRINLDHAQVALAGSATDTVLADGDVAPTEDAILFLLDTDATAGGLTLELAHDTDGAGTYVKLDQALVLGGDIDVAGNAPNDSNAPQDSLVLDMSETANQGTVIVGIAATAAERTANDTLIKQLLADYRLLATTDGSYNGTTVEVIAVAGMKRHVPGARIGA